MVSKISEFFYHILNYGGFSFKDGVILMWGDPDIMLPPLSFVILQEEIEKALQKDGNNLFYLLGHTAGKNASIVLIRKYGFNKNDFDKFTNGGTQDGYGYLKITKYPEKNKPVELFVEGTNTSLGEVVRKTNRIKSADSYFAGMMAGGSEPLFERNIRCVEEKCTGKGDEFCSYHLFETKDKLEFELLKKIGINYDELNSKILKLYLNRKINTTYFEKKDVHFGDGTFKLREIQGVLFLTSMFVILNKISMKLIKDYERILEKVSTHMVDLIGDIASPSPKEGFDQAFRRIEVYGFGKFNVLLMKEKTIVVWNENDPLPTEHKNIFGIGKETICLFPKNLLKNIAEKLTGRLAEVEETECIAQGKKKCIFKIELK